MRADEVPGDVRGLRGGVRGVEWTLGSCSLCLRSTAAGQPGMAAVNETRTISIVSSDGGTVKVPRRILPRCKALKAQLDKYELEEGRTISTLTLCDITESALRRVIDYCQYDWPGVGLSHFPFATGFDLAIHTASSTNEVLRERRASEQQVSGV